MMDKIIPAILPKDEAELSEKATGLPLNIPLFHLDVLEEGVWEDTGRDFEAHLMVKNPSATAKTWVERGAKRVIVHELGDWSDALREKTEIGLGVEMHVPLEEVFALAPRVDFVQFMSIAEIGAQGHPFDSRIFDRIKEFKKRFPDMPVSVDGGINISNYNDIFAAGADRIVAGSGFENLWEEINA